MARLQDPEPDWESIRVDLYRQEFDFVRGDLDRAIRQQHTITQWALAIFAALLAGAMLLLSRTEDPNSGVDGSALLLVTGFALPAVVWSSTLAWLGEAQRLLRAVQYARALERDFAKTFSQKLHPSPLRWETKVAMGYRDRTPGGHMSIGYLGALLIYVTTMATSMALFLGLTAQHHFAAHDSAWTRLLLTAGAVQALVFVVTVVRLVQGLLEVALDATDLADIDPAAMAYPLSRKPASRRLTPGGK